MLLRAFLSPRGDGSARRKVVAPEAPAKNRESRQFQSRAGGKTCHPQPPERDREAAWVSAPVWRAARKFARFFAYPVMRAIVIVCARAGGELERCDRLSVRA